MTLSFDIKERISLKTRAAEVCTEVVSLLNKAMTKLHRAAQRYEDEELSSTNDFLREKIHDLDVNISLYITQNRALLELSNISPDFTYFCDEELNLDDWYELQRSILVAGICLCRWRDELMEEESPDATTLAQLSIVGTLIRTLNSALDIFEANGFGEQPSIERAYQVMVVQHIHNYYDEGAIHIDFSTNF